MVGSVRVVARRAGLDAGMDVGSLQIQRMAIVAKLGLVFFQP
jgi:hypothetical protein